MSFQTNSFQSDFVQSDVAGPEGPTLYCVIGSAAGWVLPTEAEIISGVGFAGAGNTPAPNNEVSNLDINVTTAGIVPGVAYKFAVVWSDGTDFSNIVSGDMSTTSALCLLIEGDTVLKTPPALNDRKLYTNSGFRFARTSPQGGDRLLTLVAGTLSGS